MAINIIGDSVTGKYNFIEYDFAEPADVSTFNNSLCSVQTASTSLQTVVEYRPQYGGLNPFTQFRPGSGYVIRAKQNFALTPPTEDNASKTPYNDNVINAGDNGGYGFEGWQVITTGSAGTYAGSSVAQGFGDINTNGKAWGLFATSSASVYCFRNLLTNLTTGNSLSATIATQFRLGSKGLNLWGSVNRNSFLVNFNASNDQYVFNNQILTNAPGQIGFYSPTAVWNIIATQINPSQLQIVLQRRDLGLSTLPVSVAGTLRCIEFYTENASNTGNPDNPHAQNLRFNSLKIFQP